MFLSPPIFFGGEGQAPKFLDRNYKFEHTFRHVAKFRGDRPTELEDLMAKKRK